MDDHFKTIDDEHGHLAGDDVLKKVASLIKETLRESDFLARFGGEEFAVVLPQTPPGGATILAEKIRKAVDEGTKTKIPVTVSIGVASYELPDIELLKGEFREDQIMQDLLRRADRALYEAKAGGRNRVCADER